MRRHSTILLTMLVLVPVLAHAQPNLNLKRVTVNWPTIELYFSVGCNGTPAWNMAQSDFLLFDNGTAVDSFTMSCPDGTLPCPMSAALVIDGSGSMAGTGIDGAKQGAKDFINAMDGQIDEAAVLSFNTLVTTHQSMTTFRSALNAGIDAIAAGGGTAVWDGMYAGLLEVLQHGNNSCRAVVVLTDGMDNSSTHTVSELISLANTEHIRIYTIGLGSSINATELEMVALLTGGRYYQTSNASQLGAIYSEIATIIHQTFQECVITYDASCPDGSIHTVQLQLNNFCGGSDTKSKSFRAPLDKTKFAALPMSFGSDSVGGGEDFEIPLLLDTTLTGHRFEKFTFDVNWNRYLFDWIGAEIPPGSPLEGLTLTMSPQPAGMLISTDTVKVINGGGELIRLRFHAKHEPAAPMDAWIHSGIASFERGCVLPAIDSGRVTIMPGRPNVTCDMDIPRSILWDAASASYVPAPVTATLRLYNTGTLTAEGDSCEISYDAARFRLVSPTVTRVPMPDIPAGEYRDISWRLDPILQTAGDSTDVTITAHFLNHTRNDCFVRVYIAQSEPILSCSVDLPTLRADTSVMRYDPNPFEVTVTVRNVGVLPAHNVEAILQHPSEMSLAGVDLGGPFLKSCDPVDLQPGQSGTVTWQLWHPLIPFPHSDTIRVTVREQSAVPRQCFGVLDVPPIQGPILFPECFAPDSLHFDAQADQYVPNPFRVRLTCVNIGTDTARDVTGTLVLPPGLDLMHPGEPLTKTLRAGALGPWRIGNAVPEVTWDVVWRNRDDHDVDLPIRFIVRGQSKSGATLADVPSACSMRIPGLSREFTCAAEAPDTLGMNPSGSDYDPNPVPLRLSIRNSGQLGVTLSRITLAFPPEGIALDPASPQGLDNTGNFGLSPGDVMSFDWLVRVQKRTVPRLPRFEWVVYDATGKSTRCAATVFIPGLPGGALDCELSADTVVADYTAQSYHPMPFTLTLRTRSNKPAVTDSVFARVILPPGALALAASDAGREVKPLMPGRIFPQQEAQVAWMLDHPVSTVDQRYTVTTLLWEQGGDTSVCETEVFIPAIPAPFWFTLGESGPLSFCEGGQVVLDAGSGYASYLWSTQDTTQSIVVTQGGTYWCGVTANDGVPGLSNSVTVTVFPLPSTPVITRTVDVLSTVAAAAWQWYLDGNEIPGATAQTHTLLRTGTYAVRITDANGCEALSDSFDVSVLQVDEGQAVGQRFQLYPNPASGELTVSVSLDRPATAVLVLHDLLGRELRRVVRSEVSQSFTQRLDLRGLRPGLYVLQLQAGALRQSRVVVVR